LVDLVFILYRTRAFLPPGLGMAQSKAKQGCG